MIGEAEIRRLAAIWRVDPMVVDLDYCLGWFLAALTSTGRPADQLWFKGGTCLRKCYFPDYRFSEDLDFTATRHVPLNDLQAWVGRAIRWARDQDGPDFSAAPTRYEVVEDDYGSETYQVRLYFRGPLRYGGAPRAARLDITRHERLVWPAECRPLIHPFSDSDIVAACTLPCYTLQEMLAEKVRALAGQRRYAMSRDIYDIHKIVGAGVLAQDIVQGLPAKFAARGLRVAGPDVLALLTRKGDFEQDWHKRLNYLLQDASAVSFESAWQTAHALLNSIGATLHQSPDGLSG
jgi:predicted nucleotidyltransferase component of viral defense system